MLWEELCWHGLGLLVPFEEVILTDHLYPIMKNFRFDADGLFQDDDGASIYRAQGLTEQFNEYELDVNHILCPSHSTQLTPK